jgi:hypothetical protein
VWSTTFINPDTSAAFHCTSIWFRNPMRGGMPRLTLKPFFLGSRVLVMDVHADLVEVPPRKLVFLSVTTLGTFAIRPLINT